MTPRGTKVHVAGWIAETADLLQKAGVESGLRDAKLLLSAGCGVSDAQVLAEPDRLLSHDDLSRLAELRRRRLRREPVSRILGRRGFMDLDLEISPATLDPRPDTETLVEAVLGVLRDEGRDMSPLEIADLGTGSGAILIALLQALPLATGLGVDISAAALQVAKRNIATHGVDERARLRLGSWLDGIGLDGIDAGFDVIVANPPYIPSGDIAGLEREVQDYDPRQALDGGADGLDAFRAITEQACHHLRPGAWLFLEIGAGQDQAVASLLDPDGQARKRRELRIFRDLNARSRCVAKRHHVAGGP